MLKFLSSEECGFTRFFCGGEYREVKEVKEVEELKEWKNSAAAGSAGAGVFSFGSFISSASLTSHFAGRSTGAKSTGYKLSVAARRIFVARSSRGACAGTLREKTKSAREECAAQLHE